MFVGHSLLAFAIAAWSAARLGWSRERALVLGALAGAFALLPDIDVAYAVVGPLAADPSTPLGAARAFWDASTLTHRTVTHSLVVGAVLSVAALLVARRTWAGRARGAIAVGALGAVVLAAGGGLALALLLSTALPALAVAEYAARRDVSPKAVGAAAAVGLLTHPFGDLFTGQPPAMLYPLDVVLFPGRVVLSADPTLQLLGAMGVELGVLWLAVAVATSLDGGRLRGAVEPTAALGAGYGAAVLFVPAPTLSLSYTFVFGAVGVGLAGAVTSVPARRFRRARRGDPGAVFRAAATGLAALTIAAAAYTVTYLAVG